MTKCYVACEVNRHMAIARVSDGPHGRVSLDWADTRKHQPRIFDSIREAEAVVPGLQIKTGGIFSPVIHIVREVKS